MRVLLIEDDRAAVESIEAILRAEQYVCDSTDSGKDGLQLAKLKETYAYDIIILNPQLKAQLSDIGGYEILRQLRRTRVKTPVLILSESDDIEDKIKSFSLGADDYLTRPFDERELIVRIQAIVRRTQGYAHPIIEIGKFSVDTINKIVTVDKKRLHLTNKEYAILELLALRKGIVVTKTKFMDHLYGGIDEPQPNIIDVFVCRLRKKLMAATGGEDYIETIPYQGYRLRNLVEVQRELMQVVKTGRLIVNLGSQKVVVGNTPLALTNIEYAILEILNIHKGKVVPITEFVEEIYGNTNNLRLLSLRVIAHIGNLRKKIFVAANREQYIKTVRGRGYLLQDPVHIKRKSAKTIITGRLIVDLDLKNVVVDEISLQLTPMEYIILEFFSLHKERDIHTTEFVEYIYGNTDNLRIMSQRVYAHIKNLRKKITAATGDESYVYTVRRTHNRRSGYVFRDPREAEQSLQQAV